MKPTSRGRLSWLALLLWTFGICAFLWRADFPKPMLDDLFYIGAADNLAAGGDLSNPLLVRQQFPSHFFFVYPPLHSYALAGWLKIFGVSAGFMTGFPLAMYFITAISTIAILRKFQSPPLLVWLIPLAVITALMPVGLRTESFAIALTMAGLAIFERGPKSTFARYCAFSLMFLGGSAAPRMVCFSTILALYALYSFHRDYGSTTPKWKIWIPPAAAAATSFLVFAGMIGFRFGEFVSTFRFHSSRVSLGKLTLLINFLNENPFLNNAQFPLVLLTAAAFVFAWQRHDSPLQRMSLFTVAGFLCTALIGGLGAGSLWYINLALLLFVAAVLNQQPAYATKLKVTLCLALLLANIEVPIILYGQLRGKIDTNRGPQFAEAQAMRTTPEQTLLVDSTTARYVFGYHLPPSCVDINFGAKFPEHFAPREIQPGDIYLVGPQTVSSLKESSMIDTPVPLWAPFGLANRRYPIYPYQPFIIPAESCRRLPSQEQKK